MTSGSFGPVGPKAPAEIRFQASIGMSQASIENLLIISISLLIFATFAATFNYIITKSKPTDDVNAQTQACIYSINETVKATEGASSFVEQANAVCHGKKCTDFCNPQPIPPFCVKTCQGVPP